LVVCALHGTKTTDSGDNNDGRTPRRARSNNVETQIEENNKTSNTVVDYANNNNNI
jgi:hypothetical protein